MGHAPAPTGTAAGTPRECGAPFEGTDLPPERRDAIIEAMAQAVLRRRLEVPAVLFLELNKPLTMLGSTMLTFAQPTLGALFGFRRMAEWAALLRDRDNLERLLTRIEQLRGGDAVPGDGGRNDAGH